VLHCRALLPLASEELISVEKSSIEKSSIDLRVDYLMLALLDRQGMGKGGYDWICSPLGSALHLHLLTSNTCMLVVARVHNITAAAAPCVASSG
jgi:hypothetical protein